MTQNKVISMVKICTLINPLILANKWVGFNGDSEFEDINGETQMGGWTFKGILEEKDIEYVDEKWGIFDLDDEIEDKDVFDNELNIPVWDAKREFVAIIQIHYKSDTVEYVCVKSPIDDKYRVMEKDDAPYGVCFSVGETVDDAIHDGARFLDINPEDIEVI